MRRVPLVVVAMVLLFGLRPWAPGAEAARSAKLVAAGDFGARAATKTVLQGMKAANPSAALALGDLKYKDVATEIAWCNYVKGIVGQSFPFQLLSGNHDSLDVADGRIEDFVACLPNRIPSMKGQFGKQYVMDFPATSPLVRVIQTSPGLTFADGKKSYKTGDADYKWLSSAIDAGRAAGAKWIIVSAHIPCWSVASYGCRSPDFYRLLLSKRVDLVLGGHEHGYMRSHQLTSGVAGCSTIPIGGYDRDCVADRDKSFAAGRGTVFATVGTGGTPLRNVSASDSEAGYFGAMSGANSQPAYGFLDISVGENSLTGKFVRTSGSSFTDSFTIQR